LANLALVKVDMGDWTRRHPHSRHESPESGRLCANHFTRADRSIVRLCFVLKVV